MLYRRIDQLSVWYVPSCTKYTDTWYTKVSSCTEHICPLTDRYVPSALDDNKYVGDLLAEFKAAKDRSKGEILHCKLIFKKRLFRESDEAVADPMFVQLSYVQFGSSNTAVFFKMRVAGVLHIFQFETKQSALLDKSNLEAALARANIKERFPVDSNHEKELLVVSNKHGKGDLIMGSMKTDSVDTKDIDRKNEQTAAILKKQGAQLIELEALYKEEQVLRKKYYNMIEGF
ncbi:hypothetical protein BHE74_00056267 [Ensete ventricosum]|nr:hypothetical protein BHE74_00056267 [Ensete ventricosum]